MRGFTLLELLLVLFVLGVILGSAMVLAGRFDPGPTGLRAAAAAFFASSRDRARASGHPVVVEIEPEEGGYGRLRRLVHRTVLEASFEPGPAGARGLEP
ncbi:MAG: prepilin-type N-terminal cleavage/methylation domain-containing protein, partial [Planctomycetota bacterium]